MQFFLRVYLFITVLEVTVEKNWRKLFNLGQMLFVEFFWFWMQGVCVSVFACECVCVLACWNFIIILQTRLCFCLFLED